MPGQGICADAMAVVIEIICIHCKKSKKDYDLVEHKDCEFRQNIIQRPRLSGEINGYPLSRIGAIEEG